MEHLTSPQTEQSPAEQSPQTEQSQADQAQADQARAELPERDGTTRQAAIWATVIALPLTVLVAIFAVVQLTPASPAASPAAGPTPSATAPRPVSSVPVPMSARSLADRPATVCRALLSQLPRTLQGLAQRPVQAGPEQNAAYGDPPLTVACGVPAPSFPPTDEVLVINLVCWHRTERPDAVVLTTVDREVPVQLTVPREYLPEWQRAVPLSDTLVATVPSAKSGIPSGCRD